MSTIDDRRGADRPGPAVLVQTLTPAGRGAVATVRIAGPQAEEWVARRFRSASGGSIQALAPSKIAFGVWLLASGASEEIVLHRPQPGVFELHCHGGPACVAAVVESLTADGASLDAVPPDELLLALAAARTERSAAILLDQFEGAFDRAADLIEHDLARHAFDAAREGLDRLERLIPFGAHQSEPWQATLAGLPNVGKSSLINALAGYRRAIVHDAPGTTRDVVTVVTALDGWWTVLSDTAGQRTTSDPLEQAGVERARQQSASADLVVLVLDASQPETPLERALRDCWPAALAVYNKADLPPGRTLDPALHAVSASTGAGVGELARRIAERLVPEVPPAGAAVPTVARHRRRLAELRARLASQTPGAS